ncbi:hypothetical protein BC830DRAFT_826797 [Chytriomyces sp. MP71]|nr:hypothetical protein BC830DRAFT_826797 [Chytriomyces sp. MP71]
MRRSLRKLSRVQKQVSRLTRGHEEVRRRLRVYGSREDHVGEARHGAENDLMRRTRLQEGWAWSHACDAVCNEPVRLGCGDDEIIQENN